MYEPDWEGEDVQPAMLDRDSVAVPFWNVFADLAGDFVWFRFR